LFPRLLIPISRGLPPVVICRAPGQARPQVAATGEGRAIADRRHKGRGVQHANTGDTHQASGGVVSLGQGSELVVECFDTTVQLAPFRPHVLE
jgi:hypothetical protein